VQVLTPDDISVKALAISSSPEITPEIDFCSISLIAVSISPTACGISTVAHLTKSSRFSSSRAPSKRPREIYSIMTFFSSSSPSLNIA
jgi:hypothetical protein